MTETYEIVKFVFQNVNIYNEKMSMTGILKKMSKENQYRVDVSDYSGYYIFSIEDIKKIDLTNTIMIELK